MYRTNTLNDILYQDKHYTKGASINVDDKDVNKLRPEWEQQYIGQIVNMDMVNSDLVDKVWVEVVKTNKQLVYIKEKI